MSIQKRKTTFNKIIVLGELYLSKGQMQIRLCGIVSMNDSNMYVGNYSCEV